MGIVAMRRMWYILVNWMGRIEDIVGLGNDRDRGIGMT